MHDRLTLKTTAHTHKKNRVVFDEVQTTNSFILPDPFYYLTSLLLNHSKAPSYEKV